ncbi:MAG: hypothetical protein R2729_31990 [Bryobacteraceae bacterium]
MTFYRYVDANRVVIWLAALLGLGGFLPRLIGAPFFDPHLMVAFAAMAVVFQAPLICESVGADAGKQASRKALSRKVTIAAGFGFFSSLLLMLIRTVASNREIDAPYFLYPDAPVIGALLLLALGFAQFGAAAGAYLTLHSDSPETARSRLRTGFLAALLALVAAAKFGPESWRAAITALLTNDLILIASGIVYGVLTLAAIFLYRASARHPQYAH